MEGRCENCQAWIRQRGKGLDGWGICSISVAASPLVLIHVKHVANDADGFGAYMLARAEFGCVEFSERAHEVPTVVRRPNTW